jgi:RecB family exonuclease
LAEAPIAPVVTPRRTRLVRARGLRAFQKAIVDTAFATIGIDDLRSRCVLVPSHAAGSALRRAIEDTRLTTGNPATTLPLIATRAELYAILHERIGWEPPLLSDFEREALLRRAARETKEEGIAAPFTLRPGLIVELLAFYDELRRRHRTVDAFDRLLSETLGAGADYDRGAERLLKQTTFLAATYRAYERAIAASDRIDEHRLRRLLLERGALRPLTHVIVATTDAGAGPGGLWPADFDLLARLPGLQQLDVIATHEELAAGFHERLVELLPGIEVEDAPEQKIPAPILIAPPLKGAAEPSLYFTARDREEELFEVARMLKTRGGDPGRFAVVFQRPLPYLYLARQVFPACAIGYEASDALPLAAEPFAAALDTVFSCIVSDFTRGSLIDLLQLPHFGFDAGGRPLSSRAVASLNRLLREAKYLGDRAQLERVREHPRAKDAARRSLEVAAQIAGELDDVRTAPTASAQLGRLVAFLKKYERMPPISAEWRERHLRARAAVVAALQSLREAHERYDDLQVEPAELAAAVRRWIEGQTFAPRTGGGGIHLVDAAAARFGAFDELRIVGVIERDWPPRAGRSIFYPAHLLTQLGWPAEPAELAAARAAFRDLLQLPARRVSVSAPSLEDDALVAPSTFIEELESSGLRVERPPAPPFTRISVHEALAIEPVVPIVDGDAAAWLSLRMAGADGDPQRFRGAAGPQASGTFAVSHLEQYLACPFKYFAAFVLKLDEEREEEAGMSPTERGQFLHELLMEFFRRWQDAGHGAVTAETSEQALDAFRALAEERLASLSPLDRALEQARLLGSAAVAGLAERLFAFEIERDLPIEERLLEHPLEGVFTFEAGERRRAVRIRAKADRIDLLADGSLRIIDYKLGRAPKASRALQLPIYGVCATQHLEGRRGRSWRVSEAGYVAFGDPDVFRPLAPRGEIAGALAAGQQRLLDAVEGIERGEFPPRPDDPHICTYCAYAGVCRKDYVGDD